MLAKTEQNGKKKMNRLLPALVAATSFAGNGVLAQTSEDGLTFGGEVKLEYLDSASSLWAFDGDVGMSWRSGGVLGADASLDATYLDDGTDFTNVWAALVLSTGVGEFAVGAPRPLVDSLRVMPRFSSSRVVDLETSFLRGPIASVISTQDRGLTPGVTYLNTSGSLTYGAGFHNLNDGENIEILEGLMQYKAGATTLFITGEFAEVDGPNLTLLQIGAFHDAGRIDVGAAFAQLDTSVTVRTLRVYGSFDVMSSLSLRGDVLMVQDADDIYSLSATYAMDSGLFVEGGGTKAFGADEIYDVGIGFKF